MCVCVCLVEGGGAFGERGEERPGGGDRGCRYQRRSQRLPAIHHVTGPVIAHIYCKISSTHVQLKGSAGGRGAADHERDEAHVVGGRQ